jgi:hypothetical protein
MPDVKTGWAIRVGDNWHFDLIPGADAGWDERVYPTKLEALDEHLWVLTGEREALATAIARAKRMRNRLRRTPPNHDGAS